MKVILGVDPGPTESAFVMIDAATRRPFRHGKVPNQDMRIILGHQYNACDVDVAVEMVASYGMPVGAEVFETCVEIGRYVQAVDGPVELVYRRDIKLHHCGTPRASDANIIQALVDRFAPGQPNRGKGTKKTPGWFYGFSADIWQAYALAVYTADQAVHDIIPRVAS